MFQRFTRGGDKISFSNCDKTGYPCDKDQTFLRSKTAVQRYIDRLVGGPGSPSCCGVVCRDGLVLACLRELAPVRAFKKKKGAGSIGKPLLGLPC